MSHMYTLGIYHKTKNYLIYNDLAAILGQAQIKYTVTRYHIYPYK